MIPAACGPAAGAGGLAGDLRQLLSRQAGGARRRVPGGQSARDGENRPISLQFRLPGAGDAQRDTATAKTGFCRRLISFDFWKMVLLERIELSTSPLPRECSTSELQQRR